MLECLVDGEISDRVSAADRGLQYGDGLFETIAVIGGQPRFWQGHVDRLTAGCERLGIPVAPQSILLRELNTVCAGRSNCIVKIIITRGSSERSYSPVSLNQSNRIVSSHAWPMPGSVIRECSAFVHVCVICASVYNPYWRESSI